MVNQRLIIMGGKGGVGRTTVATSLGIALARQGRRTLVAHVRSKQRLNELYGVRKTVGTNITAIEPNLWAVNMHPRAAIREMGVLVLRMRAVYRLVFENRIIRTFLKAVPALEAYSMIGKAWFHTTEMRHDGKPKYETVILDGPATGHLVSMLRIPRVILDTVPEGPLTIDAEKAQRLLADHEKTSIWLVTLAEEMAVSEAKDLWQIATDELGIGIDRLVVNALYPSEFAHVPNLHRANTLHDQLDVPLQGLVSATATLSSRRKVNDKHLEQITRALPLARTELPRLFVPKLSRHEIDALAEQLTLPPLTGVTT